MSCFSLLSPAESVRKREAAPWNGEPLPRHLHTKALRDLHAMNVTSVSLFPGLDGFARSFYHEIRLVGER
jgi:hypothetical protein